MPMTEQAFHQQKFGTHGAPLVPKLLPLSLRDGAGRGTNCTDVRRTVLSVSGVTGPATVFRKNSVRLRALVGNCTVCMNKGRERLERHHIVQPRYHVSVAQWGGASEEHQRGKSACMQACRCQGTYGNKVLPLQVHEQATVLGVLQEARHRGSADP